MKRTRKGTPILLGAAGVFFAATASFAVGLSEADFEYLAAQQISRQSIVVRRLSPKEQSRLHAVINDERTKSDPASQARNVAELLEEYSSNQLWEKSNPGRLWDDKKSLR